jgi:hypothetical protein
MAAVDNGRTMVKFSAKPMRWVCHWFGVWLEPLNPYCVLNLGTIPLIDLPGMGLPIGRLKNRHNHW